MFCATKAKPTRIVFRTPVSPRSSTRYAGTIHDFGLLNALADLPTTKAMIFQVASGIRQHIGR